MNKIPVDKTVHKSIGEYAVEIQEKAHDLDEEDFERWLSGLYERMVAGEL